MTDHDFAPPVDPGQEIVPPETAVGIGNIAVTGQPPETPTNPYDALTTDTLDRSAAKIYAADRKITFIKGVRSDKPMNFSILIQGRPHFRNTNGKDFAAEPILHKLLLGVGQSETMGLSGEQQTDYVARLVNKGYSDDTRLTPVEVKKLLAHSKRHGFLASDSPDSSLTLKAFDELQLAKKYKSPLQTKKRRRFQSY